MDSVLGQWTLSLLVFLPALVVGGLLGVGLGLVVCLLTRRRRSALERDSEAAPVFVLPRDLGQDLGLLAALEPPARGQELICRFRVGDTWVTRRGRVQTVSGGASTQLRIEVDSPPEPDPLPSCQCSPNLSAPEVASEAPELVAQNCGGCGLCALICPQQDLAALLAKHAAEKKAGGGASSVPN